MGFYVNWSNILKSDFKSNQTYIIQNKIYEVKFGYRSKLSLMQLKHVILPLKKIKQIFEEWNGNLWNINFLWTQKSFTLDNLLIYYTTFLCFLPIFSFFPRLPWSVIPIFWEGFSNCDFRDVKIYSRTDQKRKSFWKSFMKGTTSILKSTIQITCKVSPVRQNMKLDIFAKTQRALLLRYERKP